MSQDDALVGKVLRDKWRIDAKLGEGGMASVYAATHRNGMRAAIKILRGVHSASDKMQARLVREGYVANKIGHPGVVRILDDDETEDGQAYLVMELLEGETWKSWWARHDKRGPARQALAIALRVLEVLAAAHAIGIVHRDIKPDNVFLCSDGAVKVLDFGIARLRDGTVEATQTGSMLGTPAFVPPEQALGRASQIEARSDLYSVAASLFTVLTGELVHGPASSPNELLVLAATKPARSLASIWPDAPPSVVELVDKGLRFQIAERWPDAAAMARAAEAAIAELEGGSTARMPPAPAGGRSVVGPPPVSRSSMIALGGAGLVGVAAIAIWKWPRSAGEPPERAPPALSAVSATPSASAPPIAPVPAPGCIDRVFASGERTCAVRRDGQTWCWGENAGRLLDDQGGAVLPIPRRLRALDAAKRIVLQSDVGLALENGRVLGWGLSHDGLLGAGVADGATVSVESPVDLGIENASALALGGDTACAIVSGQIQCWGSEAGLMKTKPPFRSLSTPVREVGLPKSEAPWPFVLQDIALTEGHYACASRVAVQYEFGETACWGRWDMVKGPIDKDASFGSSMIRGSREQLLGAGPSTVCSGEGRIVQCRRGKTTCDGDSGPVVDASMPFPGRLRALAVGGRHVCAVADEKLYCVGDNAVLQTDPSAPKGWICTPREVPLPFKVKAVVAGEAHTCALSVDGHLRCFGYGGNGDLGCERQPTFRDTCEPAVPCP